MFFSVASLIDRWHLKLQRTISFIDHRYCPMCNCVSSSEHKSFHTLLFVLVVPLTATPALIVTSSACIFSLKNSYCLSVHHEILENVTLASTIELCTLGMCHRKQEEEAGVCFICTLLCLYGWRREMATRQKAVNGWPIKGGYLVFGFVICLRPVKCQRHMPGQHLSRERHNQKENMLASRRVFTDKTRGDTFCISAS